MNSIRPNSLPVESRQALSLQLRGYSEVNVLQAYKLLEQFGFEIDWSERERFSLFDGLSKTAFTQIVSAERADEKLRAELLAAATIAQCAMEIVCHEKPFSNELLDEMYGSPIDSSEMDIETSCCG